MQHKKLKINTILILHDIRSVYNVGAIFRTADAAGVSKIYLTGLTPSPFDRFGRKRKDFAKTALGAEDSVPWEKKENIGDLIADLKKEKFKIVAVEQAGNSVDYKKIKGQKLAIMLGNEVDGISAEILKKCDQTAEIPMKGKKESLNVSVATGIALFRILNI
ncbi:MAG: TrmH family RNA methyltransferase [Candidatus Paceibacterota bacterium]|jgi:tRNA G18 (ribose-2'-O)-methylase SpoU